jgi:predicted kinase
VKQSVLIWKRRESCYWICCDRCSLLGRGLAAHKLVGRLNLSIANAIENSMGTVHIVFGPQGAGKSTYSGRLAVETRAVHFSIDDWMNQLYGADLPKPLNFAWIMERVRRCEERIWATASGFAHAGGNVVLDLGFMKVDSRTEFLELSRACALPSRLHFIDAPLDVRKRRVLARNSERGKTFSFEVTPAMFDFMEKQFQRPTDAELSTAVVSKSE